jgi:hypothetical protein
MYRIAFASWLLLAFLLVSPVALSQENMHIGRWQASHEGEIGAIQFDEDGSLRAFQDGKEMKEEMRKNLGDTVEIRYEINYAHTPVHLDIVIVNLKGNEVMRGLSIVKFVGDDEMWMKVSDQPEKRPTDFGDEKKTMTIKFKKVDEFDFDGFQ